MDKKKSTFPLTEPSDSLSGIASSCDLTGLEPVPPKTESEAESYASLGAPCAFSTAAEWKVDNGK